jgi:hypothetical protein
MTQVPEFCSPPFRFSLLYLPRRVYQRHLETSSVTNKEITAHFLRNNPPISLEDTTNVIVYRGFS